MKYAGIGWPSAVAEESGVHRVRDDGVDHDQLAPGDPVGNADAGVADASSAAPVERDADVGIGGPDLAGRWSPAMARTQVVRFILIRVEMDTEPDGRA